MKRSEVKVPFRTLTAQERETIFNISDAETEVDVYTSSPKWYRRPVARGYVPYRQDGGGASFKVPRLTVPRADRKVRVLSEERKAALAAGLRSSRERGSGVA